MSRLGGTPRVAISCGQGRRDGLFGRNGESKLESRAMPSCSASVECRDMGEPAGKGVQSFFSSLPLRCRTAKAIGVGQVVQDAG
jgi:hypothetical protein